jgi:LAS superfamily LD-carboxypeptidase LdcB
VGLAQLDLLLRVPVAAAGEDEAVGPGGAEQAGQLEAMLEAAAADGVELTGSGWRDIQTQIDLRRQHCGTSDYAVWEMPSGDCSPPVARPGYSMHEQGLAIDFVLDGDLIRSRYSSAFEWLADNAADYGFYNLPSEPWHWSTTGR